jgi:HPt (histidine-containing phosphotransfer) domain-containing protein
MREMFIEKGFNDFLAKPIDISKLDETLARWIPKDKRDISNEKLRKKNEKLIEIEETGKDHSSLANIPGVDVQQGIAMTGGTMKGYHAVLSMFSKDAEKRLPLLKTIPNADALPAFVTQVHALKSASATIGAAEVSARAAELEAAGKAEDFAFIEKQLPAFAEQLVELVEDIRPWESAGEVQSPSIEKNAKQTCIETLPLLDELSAALKSQKAEDIDSILEELMRQPLDKDIKATLEQISDEVLMAEYGRAGKILAGLLLSD